jgi:hypothetical protein
MLTCGLSPNFGEKLLFCKNLIFLVNPFPHEHILTTPCCIFWIEGGAEKALTFLATVLKRKHVFGAQMGHVYTI